MERGDLYEDDLTEEHYPSPEERDEAAATEVLDPDVGDDEGPVHARHLAVHRDFGDRGRGPIGCSQHAVDRHRVEAGVVVRQAVHVAPAKFAV